MCYGGCDCQRCKGEPPVLKSDKQICSDDWDELIAKKKTKFLTVYKIRNKQGFFSTGGTHPQWSKKGKTWVAKNHVNCHLTMLRSDGNMKPYQDCEVVTYEMVQTTTELIASPIDTTRKQ